MTRLNIRFCPVRLPRPSGQAGPPISLWAMEASESVPVPRGSGRILWRLLTSLPVVEAAQAIEKVQWYAQRWQIEVLHKVLKSGCQIEQRQLATAQRLERVLSLDLVVAWRVLCLCKSARERPDDPVSDWLPQAQWQALCCYAQRQTTPPQSAPSVRQAVRWLAQMGGFWAANAMASRVLQPCGEVCTNSKPLPTCGNCFKKKKGAKNVGNDQSQQNPGKVIFWRKNVSNRG